MSRFQGGLYWRAAIAGLALLTGIGVLMAGKPARAGEQISVTHWGVLMYGVPYAVALDKGFFKEAGIDIDGILTSKGGGTTVRNVLAGGLPYGEVSLAAAVAAIQQGIDIKIVNGGVATVGEILWVTLPDSPVKTIADLAGKKMAYTSPKSVTDMVAIMSLEKAGVKLDKVDRVATGGIGSGLTALSQGGVVAAPIMDPVWTREQTKYRPLFFAKDTLPLMMQTVGITTSDFAKAEPQKLRSIIAGRAKGVEFLYKNPKDTAAIFAKTYDLPPDIAEASIRNMIDIKYWSDGRLDRKSMDDMIGGLRIIGEVSGTVDWSKLIDESFLPAGMRTSS